LDDQRRRHYGALCIREMTGNRALPIPAADSVTVLTDPESHPPLFWLGRAAGLGADLLDCLPAAAVILVGTEQRQPTDRFCNTISSVHGAWEGITSVIVPQALTLAMAEQFGAKLPPRFQYGVMKE
jgi:glucosamine--fructose-6-phosphate aminotransferase (isomerizing)